MKTSAQADALIDTLRRTLSESPDFSKTIVPNEAPTAAALSERPGVELLSVIGEGGMAQVHLAEQTTLGRQVAVKMLRPDQRSEEKAYRLLQEAWTTGALEHPNIVPVHDITLADDGAPQIVLKRIEGRSWAELLRSPSPVSLDEQLRILMDVSTAVAFAHRRGFLHRDLKPENVLVGEAGDVYLVDWGIAVATSAEVGERFPLASEAKLVAGTPAYMAPEMLDPEASPLGPWTDIYLLGSILYELLAKRAPHSAATMTGLVHNILRGPTMPDHEPELVRICACAMHRDPKARFESALQFRAAVQDYLKHEGARAIAKSADEAFGAWHNLRAAGETTLADAALAKSRFGYQAALDAWPDFELATAKLRALDLELTEAELEAGNLESARRSVARVHAPPAELLAKLRTAEQAEHEAERRRRSLDAHTSELTYRGTRAAFSALVGAIGIVGPLYRESFVEATPLGVVAPYLASLLLAAGGAVWVRRAIVKSYVNRALVTIILGTMVGDLSLSLMAFRHGLGSLWLFQTLPIVWAAGAMIAVGTISRRFWPTAIAMTALCFAVREEPRWINALTSATNALLFLNALWVNRSWSELQKRFARPARVGD
ncbi:MAG: protein kinase [Polyangiales bacterium]